MKIDLSQFRQTVLQECADHIDSMESGLLELRSAPEEIELLNSIFRAAHSIKGGAGSFGMANLVRFTHSLENLLDLLRSSQMRATDEVIDVLLHSVDVLRTLLLADTDAAIPDDALEIVQRIDAFMPSGSTPKASDQLQIAEAQVGAITQIYIVNFSPCRELFSTGTNPLMLIRNLAALGSMKSCHVNAEALPALGEMDTAQCYLNWTIEIASESEGPELREVFEFVEHLAEISITRIGPSTQALNQNTAPPSPKRGIAIVSPRQAAKKNAVASDSTSIRVAIDKVDRLIDLVGELVIAHVMTAQMVDGFEPGCLPKLREAVASMERNTRELHERVMSVRMLPVGSLFQRYTRTIYDIAQSTGKAIELETNGEETEIDKSMLELIGDPLTHLVRNAADHGIESPEVRRAAGKPESGTIALKAFHRAGRIVIEVSDDGAGIDTGKVRSKAIERGLIAKDAQLSEDQLRMLIFEPGFSTREAISDLSGRGVGMDVVKRNVQQMSGTVALASTLGKGSTVTIELPLTLAIMEGLLVRVGDRTLVLPLLSVIETVPLSGSQIVRVAEKGEVVVIREESIPLVRLSRYLGLQPSANELKYRRLAVIVENGQKKIGLVVDELLGQQQVVVKSLERHLHKVEGLMGATILGDGCVAPIVDVHSIATMNLYSLQMPSAISRHNKQEATTAPEAAA